MTIEVTRTLLDDVGNIGSATTQAHAAVQILFKASKANLAPQPDGSHTNLGWEYDGFVTHNLSADGPACQVGLSLDPLCLYILVDGNKNAEFGLSGKAVVEAEQWMDGELAKRNLQPIEPIAVTYDLPEAVSALKRFSEDSAGLAALAGWYTLATDTLSTIADDLSDTQPGPSPVRCWPHHFDIATYVGLETGDPEEARGIGVGLSPGDGSYAEPYFYINPWPHLATENLPTAPNPGHWHTDGFVGLIATASEILTLGDLQAETLDFLRRSVSIGREKLGL